MTCRAGWMKAVCLVIVPLLPVPAPGEERWYVGDVNFTGNESIGRKELLERMRLRPSGLFEKTIYSFSALVEDIGAIKTLYRHRGYLNAYITIAEIGRDSAYRRVDIGLNVDEGPLTVIDSIVSRGNKLYDESRLLRIMGIAPGGAFDSADLASASEAVTDSLESAGYMFAAVHHSVELDPGTHTVKVIFEIREGPLVRAGDLEFLVLDKVRPEAVKRELLFAEGDPLTSEVVERSIERVYATGLFDLVRIEPLDTAAEHERDSAVTVPVLILVRESDMLRLRAGGGYETDDGWSLRLEIGYRNLFGLAHGLTGQATVSSDVIGGRVMYHYPWLFSAPLSADVVTYLERRDEESFLGSFYGVFASLGGRFGFVNTFRSWVRAEGVDWIEFPPESLSRVTARSTFLVGAGITRDTRSRGPRSGTGFLTSFESELAGLGVPWSARFYRITCDLRAYRAFGDGRFAVSTGLLFAFVNGYGEDRGAVPAQELFRAGEGVVRPVRGYEQDQITPVDQDGEVLGGGAALVLNLVEFRFPLFFPLDGALFVDAGNIWPEIGRISPGGIRWSAGPGIRLNLPFLPLRLDYGIQLRREPEGRFHLSAGLPF